MGGGIALKSSTHTSPAKRPRYETWADRDREDRAAKQIGEAWSVEARPTGVGYEIDRVLVRNRQIFGYAEIKIRNMSWGQYPDIIVSLHKVLTARNISAATGKKVFLVVADRNSVLKYFNLPDSDPDWLRLGGRTKQTRDFSDVESVFHIPVSEFKEI
tara:strand:- start:1423 stop:1896 length:474 start_codon:yes stop_codon:yes gene_type:complete